MSSSKVTTKSLIDFSADCHNTEKSLLDKSISTVQVVASKKDVDGDPIETSNIFISDVVLLRKMIEMPKPANMSIYYVSRGPVFSFEGARLLVHHEATDPSVAIGSFSKNTKHKVTSFCISEIKSIVVTHRTLGNVKYMSSAHSMSKPSQSRVS